MNIINITITVVCLAALAFYFNYREKKLNKMADMKFLEIREKYLVQIAQRKAKERLEIDKIKSLLGRLETKHKKLISNKPNVDTSEFLHKAEEIIKRTEKRSKQIEAEAHEKAAKYFADQKKEIETKMVDLVINVSKKVLSKSLDYEKQKELIEKALLEVEGDIADDSRD